MHTSTQSSTAVLLGTTSLIDSCWNIVLFSPLVLMESSKGYDFLFCDLCGTMFSFQNHKYAKCSLCGFKRSAKKFIGRQIHYTVTAEDFRRDLNDIEPFIEVDGTMNVEIEMQNKVSSILCTNCKEVNYEYTERQTRSADEGMTIFYSCPKCGDKYNQNT